MNLGEYIAYCLIQESTSPYIVYFDMDDTLTNYSGQINKTKLTPKDTVKPENVSFWENMEWLPGSKEMLEFSIKHFNTKILTRTPDLDHIKQAKKDWVKNNIGDIEVITVRRGKNKAEYAEPTTFLIDDKPETLDKFFQEGGNTIWFKNNPKEIIEKLSKYINPKLNEGLESHAQEELNRAGLFDEDSDYEGLIGKSVLELIQTMSKQGHSGFSAQWVRELFNKLSNYETLTPITSNPEEWQNDKELGGDGNLWQNKRNPAIFSKNGGKTWCHVDDIHKGALEEGIKQGISAYLILEDKIPGGLAQGKTLGDIARHHKIDHKDTLILQNQLKKGITVEMEHTTDPNIAREIAMDHLWEDPKYYDKLEKVETNESLNPSKFTSDFKKYISYINELVNYVCEDLQIERPEIKIINSTNYTQENHSFGGYQPGQNKIYLVIKGRNLRDCCVTLAHEIRHFWQDRQGLIKPGDGKDGDNIENDAQSYAGMILRKFGRENPEIFTLFNQ